MPSPHFQTLKSYKDSGQTHAHPNELKQMHEQQTGVSLPPQSGSVSHRVMAVGASAEEATQKSKELDAILKQLDTLDPDDGDTYDEIENKASQMFQENPFDGISSIVSSIMIDTHFSPWDIISEQKTDDSGKDQSDRFNDFITGIAHHKTTLGDYLFTVTDSEVKVVEHDNTNFSDLISAASNLVGDLLGTAVKVGEVVETENPNAVDPAIKAGQQLVSSIAKVVDVASQKDDYKETCSMCHIGVVDYDKGRPITDHIIKWSSFYSFLHLVESTDCGKKTTSEKLVLAYVTFGFNHSLWQKEIIETSGTISRSSYGQLAGTATEGKRSNMVTKAGWKQVVTSKITP